MSALMKNYQINITCNVGTRQGDITSNIIFNLYINDLCTLLRDKGHSGIYVTDDIPNILCTLFADDVAVLKPQ